MILIDLQQLIFAAVMNTHFHPAPTLEPGVSEDVDKVGFIRHLILNSIRNLVKTFTKEYGTPVVVMEGKECWRKHVFPHYKAKRKDQRNALPDHVKELLQASHDIKKELKTSLPYAVVQIDGAEADDVIAVLAKEAQEPVLICSSDKDFLQLHQVHPFVIRQYSPIKRMLIEPEHTAKQSLMEKICTGDAGDGIPNICSPSDTFVKKDARQKSFRKARIQEFLITGIDSCRDRDERDRFKLNQKLIDFTFIPDPLQTQIRSEYQKCAPSTYNEFYHYLITNRLSHLASVVDEFGAKRLNRPTTTALEKLLT